MPLLPAPLSAPLALLGVLGLGTVAALASPDAVGWRPPQEAGLPEGFPPPSEPGRILLKWYPALRGATVRIEGSLAFASMRGFGPLFRHIRREGIAMTAPVVSTYEPSVRSSGHGAMDMTFLYPSRDPDARIEAVASGDASAVRVTDEAPRCVVSVGVEGSYGVEDLREAVARLDAWLLENGGTWRAAGSPRRLAYQQPLPFKRLYSEVQIPVEPVPIP